MSKQVLYVDLDDTLCEFTEMHQALSHLHEYPQSLPKFYENLKPKQDGIEAIKELSLYYDTYILTAPSIYNPESYTGKRLWIEQHLGFDWCDKLIICSNKGLLKGDFLIDDHTEGRGQEMFEGVLIPYGEKFRTTWDYIRQLLKSDIK